MNKKEPSTKITINQNRIDLDEAYLQMAEVWAKRSKANRMQVGCLIVKDEQIISDGYNGMPRGWEDDVCEVLREGGTNNPADPFGHLVTKKELLHAESNAIAKLAALGGRGSEGATVYVTMSPCFECAKLLAQSKVKRVVYRTVYRDTDGIDFLKNKCGIEVTRVYSNDD